MKKFNLILFNILVFISLFMGGIPVNASSFETEVHLQNSLESDKTFSIIIGFSGKNIMAIQNQISYESEKLELISVSPVDDFVVTSSKPKDNNEYKVFNILADADHVYQNNSYAVLRFKVTDEFAIGKAARIFFSDYLAAGPYKTEFRNTGFYYTITRDEELSISAIKKTITDGTKYTIWLEDNFLLIVGGVAAFLFIVFILTHLPTGKLENRERKVIKKGRKVKKDKKSDYYDRDAAIPEFKDNKIKDKIDVVPFNPFNSNPNNFSGTSNNQTNGNNPIPNVPNNNQQMNAFGNNGGNNNNQPFNPFGTPSGSSNNNQPFNPLGNNNNQQMNAFDNSNNNQPFNPLGNNSANSSVDPNSKTIEPMFMTDAVDNKKNNNFNKFFDDEDLNSGGKESTGLFSVPPFEEETPKPDDSLNSLNAFSSSPVEEELEELDVSIPEPEKKNDDDDMDMLVFVLLLLLPAGLLFFNNVKAAEYKVEELRQCIVGEGECTEDLNYSKTLGDGKDSEYTVLDLIYTKDLEKVQSEIISEEEIAKITTTEITFPTTESTTSTTKKLGDHKFSVTLKKINSTTDSTDATEEVQEGGDVVFSVTPETGYGSTHTLDCDKIGIDSNYLEMEGKVVIDNVTTDVTCTINFKVNDVQIKLKEVYNVQDEEDSTKKRQVSKDIPISSTYKYGSSVELNTIDIPGYEFKTVTCDNNADINIINVEGGNIKITSLTPANERSVSCSLEYSPIRYEFTILEPQRFSEILKQKVEYNNTYEIVFPYTDRLIFTRMECSDGQSFKLVGVNDPDVKGRKKYKISYTHKVLEDVTCKAKQ